MVSPKKAAKPSVKKASVVDMVSTSDVYMYKGVQLSRHEYMIKKELERLANEAIIDCRHSLKAIPSKTLSNDEFASAWIAGKVNEPAYRNSLIADSEKVFQCGKHFIIAAKIGGKVYVNVFPYGNRTVTERLRFEVKGFIPFSSAYQKGGTFKASAIENALLAGNEPPAHILPDLSKGIKHYVLDCLKNELADCISRLPHLGKVKHEETANRRDELVKVIKEMK